MRTNELHVLRKDSRTEHVFHFIQRYRKGGDAGTKQPYFLATKHTQNLTKQKGHLVAMHFNTLTMTLELTLEIALATMLALVLAMVLEITLSLPGFKTVLSSSKTF